MIFDSMNNFMQYGKLAPAAWEKILKFLADYTEKSPAGRYEIDAGMKAKLQELFYGGFCDEAGTTDTIAALYADHYLIDTHTAVAANVLQQYRTETGDEGIAVFASTASPYKFCDSVLEAIGETPVSDSVERIAQLEQVTGVKAPRRLAELKGKQARFDGVTEKEKMEDVVLNFLR